VISFSYCFLVKGSRRFLIGVFALTERPAPVRIAGVPLRASVASPAFFFLRATFFLAGLAAFLAAVFFLAAFLAGAFFFATFFLTGFFLGAVFLAVVFLLTFFFAGDAVMRVLKYKIVAFLCSLDAHLHQKKRRCIRLIPRQCKIKGFGYLGDIVRIL